ncbi:MAG: hypothetical protein K1X67_25310 [Fimbriimonadaceae bacterium]|uniref:hypothetical protein n=1 Tax=Accumulibacter sp. TaxID=2053492 RepID=UPI001D6E9FA1|nr:hypothetical protein [Fimbriimonadaceae bacterium]
MDEFEKANAALIHAREYSKAQSDLRARHFHFFLIAVSAIVAGILGKAESMRYLALAGVVYSGASILLDYRYKQLIDHATQECSRLEPLIDSQLSPVPGAPLTTITYRLVYCSVLFVFLVLTILRIG